MTVIWINGTVGAGKSAVGRALADLLPCSTFLDGDDHAGPLQWSPQARWNFALLTLLRRLRRRQRCEILVIAYPLGKRENTMLRATAAQAGQFLFTVTVTTPLAVTLQGRGGRSLSEAERRRVRDMRSEGYHRRRFVALTLPNAGPSPARTARVIARRLALSRSAAA